MTVEEIHVLCREIAALAPNDKAMMEAIEALPKDNRDALVNYVLSVTGFPWKEAK